MIQVEVKEYMLSELQTNIQSDRKRQWILNVSGNIFLDLFRKLYFWIIIIFLQNKGVTHLRMDLVV